MFATVSNQTKSVSKTQRDINENDEKEGEKVVHAHESGGGGGEKLKRSITYNY